MHLLKSIFLSEAEVQASAFFHLSAQGGGQKGVETHFEGVLTTETCNQTLQHYSVE